MRACGASLIRRAIARHLSPASGRRDSPSVRVFQREIGPTRHFGRPARGRRRRLCASSLFHVKQRRGWRSYVDLLARWRKTTNLIAESTFASVWTRHIADSAQLLALAPGAIRWIDMGSGAGFPGLVIAIQLAGVPGRRRPLHRKRPAQVRFLARSGARDRRARRQFMPAHRSDRPSSLGPVDAVTARAFAPLPLTLKLARPWIERGATACSRAAIS